MTPLGLFLHELVTNSVKYGAFGATSGTVTIELFADDEEFRLTWVERGGPLLSESPQREDFGRQIVDRIVLRAGGTVSKAWSAGGLIAQLRLPNAVAG